MTSPVLEDASFCTTNKKSTLLPSSAVTVSCSCCPRLVRACAPTDIDENVSTKTIKNTILFIYYIIGFYNIKIQTQGVIMAEKKEKKLKELKDLVSELKEIRGRHTELVTVYVPAGFNLAKVWSR
jgi:hypothetical protein